MKMAAVPHTGALLTLDFSNSKKQKNSYRLKILS